MHFDIIVSHQVVWLMS